MPPTDEVCRNAGHDSDAICTIILLPLFTCSTQISTKCALTVPNGRRLRAAKSVNSHAELHQLHQCFTPKSLRALWSIHRVFTASHRHRRSNSAMPSSCPAPSQPALGSSVGHPAKYLIGSVGPQPTPQHLHELAFHLGRPRNGDISLQTS